MTLPKYGMSPKSTFLLLFKKVLAKKINKKNCRQELCTFNIELDYIFNHIDHGVIMM